MSNKIDQQLHQIHQTKRTGLMTHVVVGYPSLDATRTIVTTMQTHGADFIELQIPFSDPLADGPTIQTACQTALANGTRVHDAFTLTESLKPTITIPLLFMAYFNTVFKYGVDRFCRDASAAGISGLIVPDAPLEAAEHEGYLAACRQYGLYNIITVSPATTARRLQLNTPIVQGFVYCMARQGITGAAQGIHADLSDYLGTVRQALQQPLAVGFGISSPARLAAIAPHCDIAVVGSAIIDVISQSEPEQISQNVGAFMDQLKSPASPAVQSSHQPSRTNHQ